MDLSLSAAIRSSPLQRELVWILSSFSLPRKDLKHPVEWTNYSRGRTATGLLNMNERDPELRRSFLCNV